MDFLCKELQDKFTVEEIVTKWKSLVKMFKQELSKAKRRPSGSGTKNIYQSTWEFFTHLQFVDAICDDTDDTVDTITGPSEAKKRKASKVVQRDEREEKKLELYARAVDAIKTPGPPAPVSQTPLVEKNESVAFGNYVALALSKMTPRQFRRAKKCISDVLYEIEESDNFDQASCPLPRSAPQHVLREYSSSLPLGLSYGGSNYGRPPSASSTSSNQQGNSYFQGPQ